jgi:type I site-specific restriction endonuclease
MNDKTAAELRQAERDSIKVEMIKKDAEGNPIEDKIETKESATTDDDTTKTETKEVAEEGVEEAEDKVEASEKTEEELEAEKLEAKTAAEKARIQKRIDKEVAKRKVLETEIADLKKLLAAKEADGPKLTEEDVKKEAKRIAEETITEREFTNACNRLADAAKKLDKDFDKKINQLGEEVAPLPGYMIGILDDLDNGGAILKYFTENPDEYEEIIALTPLKMGVRLTKLGTKIAEATKTPPKKISKVPPPIDPVGGKGGTNTMVLTEADTKDMSTFVKKRAAMVEARRKEKAAGLSR